MVRCKSIALLAAVFIALLAPTSGAKAQPLLPAGWVKDHIDERGLVFLDIREEELYRVRHVVGAINRPYLNNDWRVRPLAGINTKRTEELFNARMAELGIANDNHVILIHAGRTPTDVQAAAHVYWHFKLMGHEKISIMHGGMARYIIEDGPIESRPRDTANTDYKARFSGDILARLNDVDAAVAATGIFVDYRATAYFLGISRLESVARYGTIPGAKSLPADWLTIDGGGMLRSREQLRKLYELRGIPIGLPQIVFSNTADRAALGWFVNYELLGNKRVQLYEAGMREWAANPNNRMQRQINLD